VEQWRGQWCQKPWVDEKQTAGKGMHGVLLHAKSPSAARCRVFLLPITKLFPAKHQQAVLQLPPPAAAAEEEDQHNQQQQQQRSLTASPHQCATPLVAASSAPDA
jgi:hypothetical protein